MHQFQGLKTQSLPFRGSFAGNVSDVAEPDYTSNGQPKRDFNLVDDIGAWFPCCAIGRAATDWRAPANVKVIIYFGTGRLATQGTGFALYAFRDGLILPLEASRSANVERTDVSARQVM